MKQLEWNGENSPNRNTCAKCGVNVGFLECLCPECKRISAIEAEPKMLEMKKNCVHCKILTSNKFGGEHVCFYCGVMKWQAIAKATESEV